MDYRTTVFPQSDTIANNYDETQSFKRGSS